MSFIDKTKVTVIAGNGGNGKLSFRREKFISKGGPDGGDAGNGGNVILKASRNENTLAAFRYQREIKAKNGDNGGSNNMHGRSAPHLYVSVPVGTVAINQDGFIVADLVEDEQEVIVAKGGRGGFGNAHFTSPRRQAPAFAEKGDAGDASELTLELKMIADVGLVGLPNAGKSTLLSKISNARPEIADYPFTTLKPNLGVVDIDKGSSILMADIPGLIEGAAEGKGLGHDFLRHIERTAVILHLVDCYNEDVVKVYKTIKAELKAYGTKLSERPVVIALTKTEGLDQEMIDDLVKKLKKVAGKDTPVYAISSHSGAGLKELKFALKEAVQQVRSQPQPEAEHGGLPVLRLADTTDKWNVEKKGDIFIVTGHRIEKFARRTDFENEQGVRRLRDIMRRMGITHALKRQGIEPDQVIQFGQDPEARFEY